MRELCETWLDFMTFCENLKIAIFWTRNGSFFDSSRQMGLILMNPITGIYCTTSKMTFRSSKVYSFQNRLAKRYCSGCVNLVCKYLNKKSVFIFRLTCQFGLINNNHSNILPGQKLEKTAYYVRRDLREKSQLVPSHILCDKEHWFWFLPTYM